MSSAINCALFFNTKAQQLATINGTLYPYQWYQTAKTATALTLALVVSAPGGAVKYAGFQCSLRANGSISGGSSPY